MENYVITIARGFGSGGKEIGKMLTKELGMSRSPVRTAIQHRTTVELIRMNLCRWMRS